MRKQRKASSPRKGPKKSLGQNFLRDLRFCELMVDAAGINPEDTVVEVGPGEGVLTEFILERGAKLIALEFDNDLIPHLKSRFARYLSSGQLQIECVDALQFPWPEGPYKVVANLPYYITSPLLRHFLMEAILAGRAPTELVLMVQKEVAEKIIAKDGKQSMLSLGVQVFAEAEILAEVPRTAFFPRPKVESAIIHLNVLKTPRISGDLKKLFWLMGVSFTQKRKKLSNNLAAILKKPIDEVRALIKSCGIDEDIRAERLSFEEWGRLYDKLMSKA